MIFALILTVIAGLLGLAMFVAAPDEAARLRASARIADLERELADLVRALAELQKDRDRLWQDRYALLGVKSTDGLSSSEWVMRTATAERKVKGLERENAALRAELADAAEHLCYINRIDTKRPTPDHNRVVDRIRAMATPTGKEPTDAE